VITHVYGQRCEPQQNSFDYHYLIAVEWYFVALERDLNTQQNLPFIHSLCRPRHKHIRPRFLCRYRYHSSTMSKETKRKLTRFISADNIRSLFPTRKKDVPNLQAPVPSEPPTSAEIPVINVLPIAEEEERTRRTTSPQKKSVSFEEPGTIAGGEDFPSTSLLPTPKTRKVGLINIVADW
jgi:hypothetical protein